MRPSFGDGFGRYLRDNVLASQRLFEAARGSACRVVWASSSSVYGDAETYPCRESETPTRPRSPYGVTKRACEDLARIYGADGLRCVGLRYFTVYGPRQRPDMAIRTLCEAAVTGKAFPLFGDGSQSRDFTYVSDAVDATYRAGIAAAPEAIYNVGGGDEATLAEVIAIVQALAGQPVGTRRCGSQAGDVRRTSADTTRARRSLGWHPAVKLLDGLRGELDWVLERANKHRPEQARVAIAS